MLKKGKRIWALVLAVGLLAGQLASVAMAEDSPAVAQDSGQADSGRAASTGPVQVDGFTLAFADGTTPQEGRDKDYDRAGNLNLNLYLHPQNGKELLLSGSNGTCSIWAAPYDPVPYTGSIRLNGDLDVDNLNVGGIYFPTVGGAPIHIPVNLSLNGGGHSVTKLDVEYLSHITITGGAPCER